MPSWCIAEILQHTHGTLVCGQARQHIDGVSTDSRTIQPGELFVALPGEHFDGHHYVATAFQRGATAALVSYVPEWPQLCPQRESTPAVVLVADTQAALQTLALEHRRRFHGTVIAITGSNGKTTVKEMTAAVLARRFATHKAPGNLNNHLGVPLALLGMELTQQVAVLELGMNHLGEIRHLCSIAQPHMGVITNIGLAHVGYLGSIERIQQAKGELLEALPPSGLAIVNADDPRALALGRQATARLLTFGRHPEANVRGDVQEDRGVHGIRCRLTLHGKNWQVPLSLPGSHQLMNALAAAAVGMALHVPAEQIVAALTNYRGLYGRLTIRHGRADVVIIDDTYNANPNSMQVALQILADAAGEGRHIAVLGDMLELGSAAPALHEALGTNVAHSGVQYLITLGPLGHHTAHGACQAGLAASRIHTTMMPQEALSILTSIMQPHDVILFKGSRGMAMEHLVRALATEEGIP